MVMAAIHGNQMNGHGVFYFSNGDKYEGNFENGLKHGI